jgi:hypothetical protein
MSELATILEHEAMDFITAPEVSSVSTEAPNKVAEAADTAGTAELPESGVTDDSERSERYEVPFISENLHALPL